MRDELGALATAAGLPVGAALELDGTSEGRTAQLDEAFGSSLAIGPFTDDAFADLVIGVPRESDFGAREDDAGRLEIYSGAAGGIVTIPTVYDASDTDAGRSVGARFGSSLAFGRCDATERFTLAIGAPRQEEDDDLTDGVPAAGAAGSVHVLAPHRQVLGVGYACVTAYNCEDSLVDSRRGFDRAPRGDGRG